MHSVILKRIFMVLLIAGLTWSSAEANKLEPIKRVEVKREACSP